MSLRRSRRRLHRRHGDQGSKSDGSSLCGGCRRDDAGRDEGCEGGQGELGQGPTAKVTESAILAEGARLAADPEAGTLYVSEGDISAAKAGAASSMTATYTTSTALHFTMEPQNALVEFDQRANPHSCGQPVAVSDSALSRSGARDA